MTGPQSIGVLFVCLGNICRSPTAHGVFAQRVERAGLASAACRTHSTMGLPAISSKGFPGSREEPKRAGITQ